MLATRRRFVSRFALTLMGCLAWSGAAARAQAPCGDWSPVADEPGLNGSANAMTVWDPDGAGPATPKLVVGGSFTVAGGVAARHIAVYDPAAHTWSSLGTGMNGSVHALTVMPNGDLVAAGYFFEVSGLFTPNIARWDGSAWHPLGAGVGDLVHAVAALPNGDLVAGGNFTTAGGVAVANIARWNGSVWSPLGAGFDLPVHALTVLTNGDLVAGGEFLFTGPQVAREIARWNGSAWSSIGIGVDAAVYALVATPTGGLVAGGRFTLAGGVAARSVARWEATGWSALGTGVGPTSPIPIVEAVQVMPNGDVIVGGLFTEAGGQPVSRIALWNGVGWSGLGAGLPGFNSEYVKALTVLPNGELACGGNFLTVDGVVAHHLARWNGTTWAAANPGIDGLARVVVGLAGGDFLVGGKFGLLPDGSVGDVALWHNGTLSALGGPADGEVYAVLPLPDGSVLAGGTFTTIGGVAANGIARWDGLGWTPLGSGIGVTTYSGVRCLLQLANGDVLAGGQFTVAGGVPCSNLARWTGANWSAVGAGVAGPGSEVIAMRSLPNGDVVLSGSFTSAGGVAATNIARWNGTTFSPLGAGVQFGCADVLEILQNGGVLAAGGYGSGIQLWDGATWSQFAPAAPSRVTGILVLPNGDVVAGGQFDLGGPYPAVSIRRWDGASWTVISPGLATSIQNLALLPTGGFVVAGGVAGPAGTFSTVVSRYVSTCPASATAAGSGCVGVGGTATLSASDLPWLGATYRGHGANLPPQSLALTVTGLSPLNVPLPPVLPLSSPNCQLLVAPEFVDAGVAGATLDTSLAIPDVANLLGAVVHQQLVLLAITGGAFATASSSNALQLTIGTF